MNEPGLFDEFEIKGNWWLPGDESKVAGDVRFVPAKITHAELYGCLGAQGRKEISKDKFVVHGLDREGRKWSLLNALEVDFKPSASGGRASSSQLNADFMVLGAHVASLSEISVAQVSIALPGLARSLKQASNFESNPTDSFEQQSIIWKRPAGFSIRIEQIGAVLKSLQYPSCEHDTTRGSITDLAELTLIFDKPTPFDLVYKHLEHLRNLFIALHGMACPMLEVSVSPDVDTRRSEIHIYILQSCSVDFARKPWPHELLVPIFRLNETELAEVVVAWFSLPDDVRFAIAWHSGMILQATPYFHINFVNLVQAFESLHRGLERAKAKEPVEFENTRQKLLAVLEQESIAPEQKDVFEEAINNASKFSQRQRILDLYEKLPTELSQLIAKDVTEFTKLVVKTRNFATHLDPKSESKGLAREEILFASLGLKLFFWFVVLTRVGVKAPTIMEGLRHRPDFDAFRRRTPWDKENEKSEMSLTGGPQ